jgi:hypothetical protein
MDHCSNDQLMRVVTIEQCMSREMRDLITARDYDLDRLRRACEDTVEKTPEMTNKIEEHTYKLSILNEKLRVSPHFSLHYLTSIFSNATKTIAISDKQ